MISFAIFNDNSIIRSTLFLSVAESLAVKINPLFKITPFSFSSVNFFSICADQALCFDNGPSLFCTNWTYRKTRSLEENIKMASSVARPFSEFYDKQVDACIRLGAKPLQIYKRGLDQLMMYYHNPLYDKMNNLIKAVLSDRLAYYYNKGVYEYV